MSWTMPANADEQLERVKLADITMTENQKKYYLESIDDLGEAAKDTVVQQGYKRCGKCGHVKKFFMFNKNSGSKTNTSGNCKECQKKSAASSYSNTKKKRNYKAYYQANKELKQEHARKYYQDNKETVAAKHKAYLTTKAGKRVMDKAHSKRRTALANNKGIKYTRLMVIKRDSEFINEEAPICYLCNSHIGDTSGNGLHIDHVIPVVQGGLDCFTNVASTHKECNLKREKDARELTADQVAEIRERAEDYIDSYPEQFE